MSHVATENLEELQVRIGERVRLRALDIKRADRLVVQLERNRKGAFRALRAGEVKAVLRRVLAQITLARGRDEPGYAVVLDARLQLALSGFRLHAKLQKRNEVSRLLID